MLEQMKTWLETFPGWEGVLQFDYADSTPGNSGLYPKGLTELSRREDVLGNQKIRYSCVFDLKRSAAAGEENARWLLDFQNWVARQDRLGLAPKFGDEPKTERIRAFEGRLDKHTQAGSSLYQVALSIEFTKLYRGE